MGARVGCLFGAWSFFTAVHALSRNICQLTVNETRESASISSVTTQASSPTMGSGALPITLVVIADPHIA